MLQRHLERREGEFGAQMRRHRPADDAAAARIQHHREEEKSLLGRHVGHVGHPHLIGRRGDKRALHQVRRARTRRIASSGVEPATMTPGYPRHAHEARDPLARAAHALRGEFGVNAWRAVGRAARAVNRDDLLLQLGVGGGAP